MSAPPADAPRTVKLRQGIWCDCGQHVIPQGGIYTLTPVGLFCCAGCASNPLRMAVRKEGP